MTPRPTDEAVAALPLRAARAELLEEIMSTPVTETRPETTREPHHRRWLVPIAAAAAVAALVGVPSWLLAGPEEAREAPASSPSAPATPGEWVALEAEGWTVTYVAGALGEREVRYENGDAALDVHLRAASSYDTYVEDRQLIDAPKIDPGTPVQLLGSEARLWPYSATDHTTIGAVAGKVFPEIRGSGMDRASYVELLGRLAWTDEATFEARLPEEFVADDEQDAVVAEMMAGMATPSGFEVPAFEEKDRYQLGAKVSGAVACAWLDIFAEARSDGDREAARGAAGALADSRRWPVLQEMKAEGDYPEVIWQFADEVGAGRVPEGYQDGLGCP
ncbi:hypothetical protein [Nocardioides astragali]|uniref:Uncharacterized protein n=1 Tax=Nocardioides astragali TaxID=1776736 RepID=A0ABW2N4X7_9ACTN|nr:hypothetical protein [Nocardioides astragali]